MKYLVCCGLVGMVILAGCAGSISIGAGNLKKNMNSETLTQYRSESADFKVLGPVYAECRSIGVFWGIFSMGSDGQGLLMKKATEMYGADATGVKDVQQASQFMQILGGIFTKTATTYSGTAVSEK